MDDIRVGLGNNNVNGPPLGRITGSASIETLVRVGLEKEHGLSPDSKMVVLHDFTPCVDDELEVKRGSVSLAFPMARYYVNFVPERYRKRIDILLLTLPLHYDYLRLTYFDFHIYRS